LSESLIVDKSLSLEEQYLQLKKQLESLLIDEDNLLSNFSNFIAALKQTFTKISWIGFYFLNDDDLYLGPFQGKIACTNLSLGKGVCGTAAKEKRTIVVQDVSEFEGHIACDADTRSEIVVPIIYKNEVFAVLDIDSLDYNAFNETDKKYLEILCNFLSTFINNKTTNIL